MASGPNGSVYVVYNGQSYEVAAHDVNGRLVRRIGRAGAGPGELRAVQTVSFAADTLFTFDGVGNRLSRFDTAGNYVTGTPLPIRAYRALRLSNGIIVVNAHVPTRDNVGYPLHVLSDNGSITRSFGVDSAWYRPDQTHLLLRVLARADDTTFWSGSRYEYLIERFNHNGEKVQRISRSVQWFPIHVASISVHPNKTPATQLLGLWHEHGRIWVSIAIADEHWASALEPFVSESGKQSFRIVDADRYYDTMIEVLDAESGQLIHSSKFDSAYGGFLADGRLVRTSYDGEGRVHISLSRLELVSR